MNDEDARAYLLATERYWWDEKHEVAKLKVAHMDDPDHGVELFYTHEVDAKAADITFGHRERAEKIMGSDYLVQSVEEGYSATSPSPQFTLWGEAISPNKRDRLLPPLSFPTTRLPLWEEAKRVAKPPT